MALHINIIIMQDAGWSGRSNSDTLVYIKKCNSDILAGIHLKTHIENVDCMNILWYMKSKLKFKRAVKFENKYDNDISLLTIMHPFILQRDIILRQREIIIIFILFYPDCDTSDSDLWIETKESKPT